MLESKEVARRDAVKAMLEARSVAVVGASKKSGSAGEEMMVQLIKGSFDGRVYPVNPKYEEVQGHRCYASIDQLPEPVDLVVLGVPNAVLEEQLDLAGRSGARSSVIFASCYSEPREGEPSLKQRLAAIARQHGMAICGGNCMGFMNLDAGLRALAFEELEDLEPGRISWISHSGSAFTALLHNHRGFKFNLAVSAGMELATTLADYLDYALDQESTRVVAMFLETIRDPQRFQHSIARAANQDVPVVALKVGSAPESRELVVAHCGALAGEDGAYDALFKEYGVLRVHSFDEMSDTLELLLTGRVAVAGGLAALHDSGGERALLVDTAAQLGVPITQISQPTTDRLAALLEPGLPPVNPVDAWGTGKDYVSIFVDCMQALLDDPDTGALAFAVDLADETAHSGYGYVPIAEQVFAGTDLPVAVLTNLTCAIPPEAAKGLRENGIPVLEGTVTGLRAFQHLFARREFLDRPPLKPAQPVADEIRKYWRSLLANGATWGEMDGLKLLADYNIPVAHSEIVSGAAEAVAAAKRLGWPVVLKTATPDVAHKSDVGGVVTGLNDAAAVEATAIDLVDRLGTMLLVQAAATPGVELALGVVRDAQFGPLVMVAAGGVLVELVDDTAFALPPLDELRATMLLDGLLIRRMLDGLRGTKPADLDAVVHAIVRLSVLAADLGDLLEGLDVNPLIAAPDGCMAVDALVVPRTSGQPDDQEN